ncbi:MAG: stage III sporulation protein AG [Oscillospiraceae bacterium]|nr:stage III sporulation protein AG [Oscillospiraceae bacterium]
MKFQWKPPEGAVWKLLDQYKYVLIAIAAGIVLLLWPTGGQEQTARAAGVPEVQETFDLEALEKKLSQTLSQVEGAGEVTVTLTVKSGMEQVLASDRTTSVTERGSSVEEETVLVNSGGGQETVLLTRRYPTFQGALVVCQGGDDAGIRLLLTQAVSALTGRGADRIPGRKGG